MSEGRRNIARWVIGSVVQADTVQGDVHVHQVVGPEPVSVLELLAGLVRRQWLEEMKHRRLLVPQPPLPVRLVAAGDDVVDDWRNIHRDPGRPDAADLRGSYDDVLRLWHAVPGAAEGRGRLAVVGEPGAGKTALALNLLVEIIRNRAPGSPVPVLVDIASWNPLADNLMTWLEEHLERAYPLLRQHTANSRSAAYELVSSRLIVPVFDGLDEMMPPARRVAAIGGLNDSLSDDHPFVLTCRLEEYRQVCASGARLAGAPVVLLVPVPLDTTRQYLERTAPGTRKWQDFFTALAQRPRNDPLREVFANPLMISLARCGYSDTAADPARLLRPEFASRAAIEDHLLDGVVSLAFPHRPSRHPVAARWHGKPADRWLRELAATTAREGTGDIAWWRLERQVPRVFFGAAFAVLTILAVLPLAAFAVGLRTGATFCSALALTVMVMAFWRRPNAPALIQVRFRWSRSAWSPDIWRNVLGAAGMGAVTAVVVGPVAGAVTAGAAALATLVVRSTRTIPVDTEVRTPRVTMAEDRAVVLQTFAVLAVLMAPAVVIATLDTTWTTPVALAVGAVAGLFTMPTSPWVWFVLARWWFAACGKLPWRLMRFLDDAHALGVLRQAGNVYQFRHLRLRERLAAAADLR
ncbi:NACHT domain-containing protein [Lentzea sp. NPDC060358]|uniref:NACHT domain-containing protein n=1 Tax=Lentzea sp. NPDC060358 TaxID=3347103 RepID=UPI00365E9F03